MIVTSIWDFTVGTTAFLLLLFGHCTIAPSVERPDLRMDGRSLAALKARALQVTTRRPGREMCSLCVCSALRKRMASLSFCVFPQEDGRTREGEGHCEPVRKCFIWRCKFCTIGLDFRSVLFVCVCFFLEKLYLAFHAQLSLLTPAFILHAGLRERTCMLNSWMRPNQTKGTCISK